MYPISRYIHHLAVFLPSFNFVTYRQQQHNEERGFWDYLRTLFSTGKYTSYQKCEDLGSSREDSFTLCPLDECLYRTVLFTGTDTDAGLQHEGEE